MTKTTTSSAAHTLETANLANNCHLCGSPALREFPAYTKVARVTSDCKNWPAGGHFAICECCGYPQTVVNSRWREEIKEIYNRYTIYYQGEGTEQSVFDPVAGGPRRRSDVIVDRLLQTCKLPRSGALLDVGCGNGNFFKAFTPARPQWSLDGLEWDNKHEADNRKLPAFRKLHLGSLEAVDQAYNLISIIHCLEHVPNPAKLLKEARALLAPDGILLIQVPDCSTNPFYLSVADHCSHFSVESLAALVQSCGFDLVQAGNSWVSKEVSIIAKKSASFASRLPKIDARLGQQLTSYIDWLTLTAEHAKNAARNTTQPFGIFGRAIAGTWLYSSVGQSTGFFVDEDPSRIGQHYLDRPIFAPGQVPDGAVVYIGLPPAIASSIQRRLLPKSAFWVVPPTLG